MVRSGARARRGPASGVGAADPALGLVDQRLQVARRARGDRVWAARRARSHSNVLLSGDAAGNWRASGEGGPSAEPKDPYRARRLEDAARVMIGRPSGAAEPLPVERANAAGLAVEIDVAAAPRITGHGEGHRVAMSPRAAMFFGGILRRPTAASRSWRWLDVMS
jgi:hypothetical protein